MPTLVSLACSASPPSVYAIVQQSAVQAWAVALLPHCFMMLSVHIQVIVASIVENWYQTALSLTPFAAAALARVEGMSW